MKIFYDRFDVVIFPGLADEPCSSILHTLLVTEA